MKQNSFNLLSDLITPDELKQIFPQALDQRILQYQEEFNTHLPNYDINTPLRLAAFLAQGAVDSNELNVLTDNFNFSTAKILQTWPEKFRNYKDAEQYANNPQKLCNYIYANKLGNSNQLSGDGYKYRGRGFLKGIGKNYYQRMKDCIGVDFITYPDLITAPRYSVLCACITWSELNLNELADEENVKTLFRRLNNLNNQGNNFQEKMSYYNKAKMVLKC